MGRKKTVWAVPTAQLLAILVLSLAIYLIVDYGQRASADYYVSQAEKEVQAQIDAEVVRNQELQARRDYVKTPEYIERWAREHAHMVQEGDKPVILVLVEDESAPLLAPAPAATPDASAGPPPQWHAWWAVFFDSDPGATIAR